MLMMTIGGRGTIFHLIETGTSRPRGEPVSPSIDIIIRPSQLSPPPSSKSHSPPPLPVFPSYKKAPHSPYHFTASTASRMRGCGQDVFSLVTKQLRAILLFRLLAVATMDWVGAAKTPFNRPNPHSSHRERARKRLFLPPFPFLLFHPFVAKKSIRDRLPRSNNFSPQSASFLEASRTVFLALFAEISTYYTKMFLYWRPNKVLP